MVYLNITPAMAQFIHQYEQHYQTTYFNRQWETVQLKELNNQFIKMAQLREYVNRYNHDHPSNTIILQSLFNADHVYYTTEFKLLETEASITQEDRLRREQLLNRAQERQYQRSLSHKTNKGIFAGESVKDIEKSMSFGVSFIFTLFLSGLSGFYFGKHIMQWQDVYSLVLALFVTIVTLLMEITLFIIKTDRDNQKKQKQKKVERESQQEHFKNRLAKKQD